MRTTWEGSDRNFVDWDSELEVTDVPRPRWWGWDDGPVWSRSEGGGVRIRRKDWDRDGREIGAVEREEGER